MKKTLYLLAAVIPLMLFSCASIDVVPSDIQFTEIKGDDYLDTYMNQLIEKSNAYKIVDVYISQIDDVSKIETNPRWKLLKLQMDLEDVEFWQIILLRK